MNLTYVIDYVFRQTPDGYVWTDTSYDRAFWDPYVNIFGTVTLLCRVEQVTRASASWRKVTGEGVQIAAVPVYRGAFEYLRRSGEIKQMVRASLANSDAVILRIPSNLARIAAKELQESGHRYAVEVMGDAEEALARGVVRMPGRAFLRSIFAKSQRSICASASGAAYVANVLRQKYPAPQSAPTLVCSDVRLTGEWLRSLPRHFDSSLHRRLITVATLSQTYKGIDVLLRALRICRDHRFDVSLTIVGTGKYEKSLKKYAARLGLNEHVDFVGTVPWGPELIEQYDAADLFVLPSRVEVMPRALLEAMARALPAVATRVGAVHEVLGESEIVAPGDAVELSHRLMHLLTNSRRLESLSSRNLARANQFSASRLMPVWHAYQVELLRALSSKVPARWQRIVKPSTVSVH